MARRIIPAIMSGGAGARLWPASTEAKPKQFHALTGTMTLFAQTAQRLSGVHGDIAFAPPIISSNAAHADLVDAALAEAGVAAAAIVLEPSVRNTAAVGAIAAQVALELDPNALVLLAPADHIITDAPAFYAALGRAAPHAGDRIVTFGIEPDQPATAYGYIKRSDALGEGVFQVEEFKEKPALETAKAYLAEGGYSWNSGMFLVHPRVLLEEFEPSVEIRERALHALKHAQRRGACIVLDRTLFDAVPAMPIDVAVMEKTKRAAVAPCAIGWADIGAWDEIWRLAGKDASGNALQGAAFALDGNNNLVRADDGLKVCVAGVSDLIIVATREGVIVLPRARAQDVKELRALTKPTPNSST